MDKKLAHWIDFGAILIATGGFVCCMFHFLLGIRWIHRERQMKANLESLSRDPYMVICADEQKIGKSRRVVFS